ncbi:hypothetical protein DVK85_11795 [Flavobacterium arcticum]|uniref:Uncharacterized protein n=1 Tax=Flavobacterium arcticum TaxID=1784713 RepID=A0A345HE63_9FLAO|nr:hypothetical protein [Flavobacterium arcticum]AXG74873.1 hypothetical protein DVK85_11795 [Flavobacterium arcticum]KAF2509629.1 hypothetical protein E0W72_08880 [Flavobacterium arcticum]
MKNLFRQKRTTVNTIELIDYPSNSLGFHLGQYLFKKGFNPCTILEKEDIYRLLITKDTSVKEQFGMYFYLFGNGDASFDTLSEMLVGLLAYPFDIKHFCNQYKAGKNALRFYDLDHYKMLHLPLDRIKDTFLIR